MLYYVALAWNGIDAHAAGEAQTLLTRFQASAREWRLVLSQNGLAVLARTSPKADLDQIQVLPNRQGVVIGRLFERVYVTGARACDDDQSPASVILDERKAASIIASGGRELVESYWGRYIGFLRDPDLNTTWVVRDPTGAIPCQTTRLGRVQVYFVRIEDYERLGSSSFSVNHRYLLGYLLYNSICVHATGLDGIETVLPGECVEHARDVARRHFYWNPLQIAQANVIEDPAEAVRAMRRTVRACVHAWASCFDGVLLDLSGGVDSTIVLACLASAPMAPRLLCRHNYSTSGDLDERSFARSAAQRAGVRLLEQELNPAYELPPLDIARRCLSPFPQLMDARAQQEHVQLMQAENLSAHFSGDGGDEIFYRTGPLPTAVDYAWRRGISGRLLSIAANDAAYARSSFWRTLRVVARYGVRKQPWSLADLTTADHRSLMREEVIREASSDQMLWHPLYRGMAQMEPCKFTQAYHFSFGASRGYVPGADSDVPPYVTPLISQPLMELSLRIPAYVLMKGGRDRAIAREAFVAEMPAQIARRRSKGAGNAFLYDVLWTHIDSARELLLDGFLVRAGYLDRTRLEAVLSGGPTRIATGIVELAMYLDVEKWVHSWSSPPARAAA